MHSAVSLILLSLGLGASARSLQLDRRGFQCPSGTCSFTLSIGGKPIYENPTDAHQVAYGGTDPGTPLTFCISSTGVMTDVAGICGITQNTGGDDETSQFQCDASSSSTFTINCSGYLEYQGSPDFYACLASESIGYNIYATPPSENQCASGEPQQVEIEASGCYSACPSNECPGTLSGDWQFPHLIVPISSSSPNSAAGTSYDGDVTPATSSIFNFDVPSSYEGQTCTVVFDFPEQSQLTTSGYTLSGTGSVGFAILESVATSATNYANAPAVAQALGTWTLAPGNSYTVWSGDCAAGEAVAFELSTESTTELSWFQDYNSCPIGLYMLA